MPPKITLHHLVHSRANRIFWCLEELGLKYAVKVHYRGVEGRAPASLKALSRLGKAPILELDGQTLRESGSIIHTLLTRYSAPGVETPPEDASIYWSHYSEGSLMAYLASARSNTLALRQLGANVENDDVRAGLNRQHKAVDDWAAGNVQAALEEVDLFLDQKKNFTGKKDLIGAGDFMMSFPLNALGRPPKDKSAPRPFHLEESTLDWLERIKARPAFKAAEERRIEEEKKQAP